ncbi:hypothetical protein EYF80_000117 [Liparis tanakae]|uniref:Uncharacterized protein n=1 Tax=Liparis tanakae TaxID=230148 RepID=A0A4Z2JID1_9TELE|nr:hypothetical protein EYF80_000117 [Liparis tanakae]
MRPTPNANHVSSSDRLQSTQHAQRRPCSPTDCYGDDDDDDGDDDDDDEKALRSRSAARPGEIAPLVTLSSSSPRANMASRYDSILAQTSGMPSLLKGAGVFSLDPPGGHQQVSIRLRHHHQLVFFTDLEFIAPCWRNQQHKHVNHTRTLCSSTWASSFFLGCWVSTKVMDSARDARCPPINPSYSLSSSLCSDPLGSWMWDPRAVLTSLLR